MDSNQDAQFDFVPPDYVTSGLAEEVSRDVRSRIERLEDRLRSLRMLSTILPIRESIPTLADVERAYVEFIFNRLDGHRASVAKTLDIGIRTLSEKLREWGYPRRGGPGSNETPISQEAVA